MKKYYAFNGSKLEFVGEFKRIGEALSSADEQGIEFFYITDEEEWKLIAGKILGQLGKVD